ncbi:hypothetical protein BU25DRAFT_59089 [Macroventuria anomochaeta]|uniref:Uncharacterized protein n=1 Tax=Macroventuria anomochaeta TaxID=301207 RepID=A0ACB6S3K3_9PLEO|nr:uncharacterized protein BU25DRAFT_59089 [Macroventuria anomochaeta]KAF2627712.1 hypothetical protein BU25DRAFT_59089 [Macroventuria anomochaeta]
MSKPAPRTRVAYFRTSSTPERGYEKTRKDRERFLETYVRQSQSLGINNDTPRHYFYFTVFTKDDQQILDILIDNFPSPPQTRPEIYRHLMWGVLKSDIHLHTSSAYAESANGRRTLQRCLASGFSPTVHDSSDIDCDNDLLEQCDYVIDINYLPYQDLNWFWQFARPGIRQDNMLSNPKYRVSQHDISKKGLAGRTKFSIWGHNSGCYHGNYDWGCRGCGGKCKRGRCKVNPQPERVVPETYRLPEKGSTDSKWKDLTATDVLYRYRLQHYPQAPGKWHKGRDDWGSVDTFSDD